MKKLPSNHIITYFDAIFFDNLIFIEIEEKNPSNHNIKQFDRIFWTIWFTIDEEFSVKSKHQAMTEFLGQFGLLLMRNFPSNHIMMQFDRIFFGNLVLNKSACF